MPKLSPNDVPRAAYGRVNAQPMPPPMQMPQPVMDRRQAMIAALRGRAM